MGRPLRIAIVYLGLDEIVEIAGWKEVQRLRDHLKKHGFNGMFDYVTDDSFIYINMSAATEVIVKDVEEEADK